MAEQVPFVLELTPSRIELLKTVLPTETITVLEETVTVNPEVSAGASFPTSSADPALQQVLLANSIAELAGSDTDAKFVKAVFEQAGETLSAVAKAFDSAKVLDALRSLETAAPPIVLPEELPPQDVELEDVVKEPHVEGMVVSAMAAVATPMRVASPIFFQEEFSFKVEAFKRSLFNAEPAAFLSGMSARGELPVHSDKAVQDAIQDILDHASASTFHAHGTLNLLSNPEALASVPIEESTKPQVIEQIQALQTAAALAPAPEVVPILLERKATSAFAIAQLPEAALEAEFVSKLGNEGADLAKAVHARAKEVTVRNDAALTSIVQLARGVGIAAVDGDEDRVVAAKMVMEAIKDKLPEHVNLSQLFGSLDYCECDDCCSVLSPAAYFVELLQYLESNNLTKGADSQRRTFIPVSIGGKVVKVPIAIPDPEVKTYVLDDGTAESYIEAYIDGTRVDVMLTSVGNPRTVALYIDNQLVSLVLFTTSTTVFEKPGEGKFMTFHFEGDPLDVPVGDEGSPNPLSVLLSRRPDLAHLELTCANSKTELPYIDLANEVMESYVSYLEPNTSDRSTAIKPFNVPANSSSSVNDREGEGGSTAELMTQPQNTQFDAYRTLRTAVYPPTALPFNQPVFALRRFLELLKTNAGEINEIFAETYVPPRWTLESGPLLGERAAPVSEKEVSKSSHEDTYDRTPVDSDTDYDTASDEDYKEGDPPPINSFIPKPICEEDRTELTRLHRIARQNSADAEALDLSLEEYIILTKQAFWPARHFQILYGDESSKEDYRRIYEEEIGVSKEYVYWGYQNEEAFDLDIKSVKSDFLPRSGLEYSELVELLKMEFINPHLPKGRDKVIFSSIRTDFMVLYNLQDDKARSLKSRFAKVIAHLEQQGWFEEVSKLTKSYYASCGIHDCHDHLDVCRRFYGCKHRKGEKCECEKRWFRHWIYDNFPSLCSLLVLISDEVEETCDINGVQLLQLTEITLGQATLDRMHCFLRLWRKLGWTMSELDAALRGFGAPPVEEEEGAYKHGHEHEQSGYGQEKGSYDQGKGGYGGDKKGYGREKDSYTREKDVDDVDWVDFKDSPSCSNATCNRPGCGKCSEKHTRGRYSASHSRRDSRTDMSFYAPSRQSSRSRHGSHKKHVKKQPLPVISSQFLHSLVALKELVKLTDLSVKEVLTFWTPIDTYGPDSLYKQLFLSHNMLALDPVFRADEDGNYLTNFSGERIAEHTRGLCAALRIKADDLDILIKVAGVGEELSLDGVSALYRHVLLGKVLGVPIPELGAVLEALPYSTWTGPEGLRDVMKLWVEIQEQGFTFKQLSYVLSDVDNAKKPFTPSLAAILKLAKTIYDSLAEIEAKHPLPTTPIDATAEVIVNKLALVRDDAATLGPLVISFLEGTNAYSTNAPKGLGIEIPEHLKKKITYVDGPDAKLQVVGQLTDKERAEARALSSKESWKSAFERVTKQAEVYFKTYIAEIFTDKTAAAKALLSEDIEGQTGPEKRFIYLIALVPFVRSILSKRAAIEPTASAANLSPETTEFLLRSVVKTSRGETGLNTLLGIKNAPEAKSSNWEGFLLVSETASYSFGLTSIIDDEQPADLVLDGDLYPFARRSEDPSNTYLTYPIRLIGGRSYKVRVFGQLGTGLKWKTSRTALENIPTSSLLPEYSREKCTQVVKNLVKISLATAGFELNTKEVEFFANHLHGEDFGGLDLNDITWETWKRLADYTTLKKSFAATPVLAPLIDLFQWSSSKRADSSQLVKKLIASTGWTKDILSQLLAKEHFNLFSPRHFQNEVALIRLQKAINLHTQTGVGIPSLFRWARPRFNFSENHEVALDIEKSAKALYTQTEWEEHAKETYDKLRTAQNAALVAFLTNHEELRRKNVIDADSLFEYFLIDVQMCPCQNTTRLLQATSSIQLFVQRCFLGLEPAVPSGSLDKRRWELMGKYRLSELNKKIFLWPENVLKASLRDDKSPLFTEFEGELASAELTPENIITAVKSYIGKLASQSSLEIQAIYEQNDRYAAPFDGQVVTQHRIHIFARTQNTPYKYYHRYYDVREKCWYPWLAAEIDIPTYEPMDPQFHLGRKPECFLIPFSLDNRLILATPVLLKKTGQAPYKFSDEAGEMRRNITAGALDVADKQRVSNAANDREFFDNSKAKIDAIFASSVPTATEIKDSTERTTVTAKWNATSGKVHETVRGLITEAASVRKDVPIPEKVEVPKTYTALANSNMADNAALQYWELKLAWTEFRDGKWTARMMTGDAATYQLEGKPTELALLEFFNFVPERTADGTGVDIVVHYRGNSDPAARTDVGTFRFDGSEIQLLDETEGKYRTWPYFYPVFRFQKYYPYLFTSPSMKVQRDVSVRPMIGLFEDMKRNQSEVEAAGKKADRAREIQLVAGSLTVYTSEQKPVLWFDFGSASAKDFPLHNKHAKGLLSAVSNTTDISLLQQFFNKASANDRNTMFGRSASGDYSELAKPYSLYNWEIGFHIPMLLVETLAASQQFELAIKVFNIVFDPTVETNGDPRNRWRFAPFQENTKKNTIENLLRLLDPAQNESMDGVISQWRNKPHFPHVIARARPVVYMKWAAIKYIEVLVGLGDFYFKQESMEALPQALQCYIVASHVYGKKGEKVGVKGKKKPETFNSLSKKWDAFSNAMVGLELAFPFVSRPNDVIDTADTPLPNIFGFATSRYFCIPNNKDIFGLRDLIADRLFKIRHCQDISGVERKLALYEPPIDPKLAVEAAAAGISISSILNDLNAGQPLHRFSFLHARAMELVGICGEVKELGGGFLAAKQRFDEERMALLEQKHGAVMESLILEQKKMALLEATQTLQALQASAAAIEDRRRFYLRQAGYSGASLEKAMGQTNVSSTEEFKPITYDFISTVSEGFGASNVSVNKNEKYELDLMFATMVLSATGQGFSRAASYFAPVPRIEIMGAPFGVGVETKDPVKNIQGPLEFIAGIFEAAAAISEFNANRCGKIAEHERAYEDRIREANAAGYELQGLKKQIVIQKIVESMAAHELVMQERVIAQQAEVTEFLKTKHTRAELYDVLANGLKELHFQTYSAAYEWAKKAQAAYIAERGVPDVPFIKFGYWDVANSGLLAGEKLSLALKKLQIAYLETRGYDYEITRSFSLRDINPLALMLLRENSSCEFAIPELLFDMDFPGHYHRRIKSVSLSFPDADVGPYTSINCTLRLLTNKFRTSAVAKSKADYPEKSDSTETDPRFRTNYVPISAIAVSSTENDSGMFELDFASDACLPFEGAGAISSWRIELPSAFKQFDYTTIPDVLITLKYTSKEGGKQLKDTATETVRTALARVADEASESSGGLAAIWDIPADFPNEWNDLSVSEANTLYLPNVFSHLPFYARGNRPDKLVAVAVDLYTEKPINAKDLLLKSANLEVDFHSVPTRIGSWNVYASERELNVRMEHWNLKVASEGRRYDGGKMMAMVRYVMK